MRSEYSNFEASLCIINWSLLFRFAEWCNGLRMMYLWPECSGSFFPFRAFSAAKLQVLYPCSTSWELFKYSSRFSEGLLMTLAQYINISIYQYINISIWDSSSSLAAVNLVPFHPAIYFCWRKGGRNQDHGNDDPSSSQSGTTSSCLVLTLVSIIISRQPFSGTSSHLSWTRVAVPSPIESNTYCAA